MSKSIQSFSLHQLHLFHFFSSSFQMKWVHSPLFALVVRSSKFRSCHSFVQSSAVLDFFLDQLERNCFCCNLKVLGPSQDCPAARQCKVKGLESLLLPPKMAPRRDSLVGATNWQSWLHSRLIAHQARTNIKSIHLTKLRSKEN